MEFQEWFKLHFGPMPTGSMVQVQNEIEELQERLNILKEKRFQLQEAETLQRGAYYAWNFAQKNLITDKTKSENIQALRGAVSLFAVTGTPSTTPTTINQLRGMYGPNN